MILAARYGRAGWRGLTVSDLGAYDPGSMTGTGPYSVTQSGVNIGEPSTDRLVILAIGNHRGAADTALDSVTINGVTATLDVNVYQQSGAGMAAACICHAIVPTGSSVDVVISKTAAALSANHFNVWVVRGYASATPYHTTSSVGTSSPRSGSLNIPSGGFAIGSSSLREYPYDLTWTFLTETSSEAASITGEMETAAAYALGSATGQSIETSDSAGTPKARALALASWR